MFILGTQRRFRMYQKLEFMQEVGIQHPVAAWNCTLCTLLETLHDILKAGEGLVSSVRLSPLTGWVVGGGDMTDDSADTLLQSFLLLRPV